MINQFISAHDFLKFIQCSYVIQMSRTQFPPLYCNPGIKAYSVLINLFVPLWILQRLFCLVSFHSSVPKTVVGGSLRRSPPQLDLLSELQQTDSSFPLTGLSSLASGEGGGGGGGGGGEETEGACSTSDQVSDIVNEVAPEEETAFGSPGSGGDRGGYATTTSSSRNTVLTSTSTIRPTNFSNSLASSLSIHETGRCSKQCGRAISRIPL